MIEVISEIENFKLCGPSDDPDEQTSMVYGFSYLLKNFKHYGGRLNQEFLRNKIELIKTQMDNVYEVYDARADVMPLIEDIKYFLEDTECDFIVKNESYIAEIVIISLSNIATKEFELIKLIQICKEININYQKENYISVSLLIRAIMNYIPPIFGYVTFTEVANNSPRSVKALLLSLEDNLRKVADFHTHNIIRKKDSLPSKNQIEPFKANVEVLLHEVIERLSS